MKTVMTLKNHVLFTPTSEQVDALNALDRFLANPDADVFIMGGAAGTGKTTLTRAITAGLHDAAVRFYLAAPTGRAARAIQQKTGFLARTIHSLIYIPQPDDDNGVVWMKRKVNEEPAPTVFIFDEASMISSLHDPESRFITPNAVLADLIAYVKEGNPANKLIFVGDRYQLPPVKESFSAALDATYLFQTFGLACETMNLTEIKRQHAGSYALENSVRLRQAMDQMSPGPQIQAERVTNPYKLVDHFLDHQNPNRSDTAMMLAWTNQDVNWMNSTCRERLGISGTVLAVNDPVILQYPCWLGNFNMLLNGEQGMISAVGGLKRYANLNFQEVTVTFRDLDGHDRVVQSLALLDVVQSTKGLLTTNQEQMLVHQVLKDNSTYRESRRKSDDRYLSALRLRHAYALTVHKAQGGEWDYVYMHPYLCPDLRWQYTAVTRARAKLFTCPRPNVTNFTFFG